MAVRSNELGMLYKVQYCNLTSAQCKRSRIDYGGIGRSYETFRAGSKMDVSLSIKGPPVACRVQYHSLL